MKRYFVTLLVVAALAGPLFARGERTTAPPAELKKKALLERLSLSSEKPWTMEWDKATQTVRQLRFGLSRPGGESPERVARRFLVEQSDLLNFPSAMELLLIDEKVSSLGIHIRFEQRLYGIPIYGSRISVHLDSQRRIFWINNQSVSTDTIANRLQLTEDEARMLVLNDLKPDLRNLRGPMREGLYFMEHEQSLRYVWRVEIPANTPLGDWSYLVDGESGEILQKLNRLQFARGRVFFPNPVVTLQDPTLRDPLARDTGRDPTTADANCAPALIPVVAYREVELAGLSSSGMLDGEFVTTAGANVPVAARAKGDPNFWYRRCDVRFNEVNVYYTIDSIQRYIQQLGFHNVNNRAIPVNANGFIDFGRSQDQSFYSPETRELVFGLGGIHDAEDGEIVAHEYGHAIQDDQVPGFARSHEAQSLGEGFGDILAALFFVPYSDGFHDELIGKWDATFYDRVSEVPRLRSVESDETFFNYDPGGNVHRNGTIWAASLWDFFKRSGATQQARDTLIRLLLESQFLYRTDATFEEAAQALIAADQKLNNGAHEDLLGRIFSERRILRNNFRLPPAQLREMEPNDSVAAAATLTDDQHVLSGQISSDTDVDFYRFTLRPNQLYVIETYAKRLTPASTLDSFLEILDAFGNRIPNTGGGFLENNDLKDGGTQDSRIVFASPTVGNLFIRVSSFRSASRGSYLLLIHPTENALHIARVSSNGSTFTGVALANTGVNDAIIGLVLFDDEGQIVDADNPRLITLSAGKQISLLDSEMFGYQSLSSGWLQVRSNSPDVKGYFLYGGPGFLLGADATAATSTESVFLLASASATSSTFPSSTLDTEIHLVNPNASSARIEITVYGPRGQAVISQSVSIRPFGHFHKFLSEWVKAALPFGYIRVRSDRPISGFEVHGDQRITGLRLRAISETSDLLYVPHFVEAPIAGNVRLFTILDLVNPTRQQIRITITPLAESGTPFEDLKPQSMTLEPGQMLETSLRDLFDMSDLSKSHVGSLRISGSASGLLGAIRYGHTDNQYIAAVAIEALPKDRMVFPQVAHADVGGTSYLAGIALHNPNHQTAFYTLKLFASDGRPLGQGNTQSSLAFLQPGQKVAKLLSELIPDLKPTLGGYLVIESNLPLLGFQLIAQPGSLTALAPQ
ncbi:MAG: M36 family metallopeptidase [Acidobacteria bacterium]|nr:M36 family metallopeptidase [Acidobacteriota bacterium]